MLECNDKFASERNIRAANLIGYLDRINDGKGPGFQMFGIVVDLRLLRSVSVLGFTLLGPFVAYLIDLGKAAATKQDTD